MSSLKREVELRYLAEPSDVNFGGKVHGGMVMKWIDQAGYAGAVGWSECYCVTVAVGAIRFLQPILIGDLVTVRARLIHTGTSRMHFAVDVSARDLKGAEERLATRCVIVALDAPDGKPTTVEASTPLDEKDRRPALYAQRLQELSRTMEGEVARFGGGTGSADGSGCGARQRFLSTDPLTVEAAGPENARLCARMDTQGSRQKEERRPAW